MNERTKELAEQAENYADGIVDQGGEFHETYTKKFAQLIVRECLETIQNKSMNSNDEWEDGLVFAQQAHQRTFWS
jgi:hypothetical protein